MNLENWARISAKSPKEGFNDTVFQHLMVELKHSNLDIQMDLQLIVPSIFVFIFSILGCYVTF